MAVGAPDFAVLPVHGEFGALVAADRATKSFAALGPFVSWKDDAYASPEHGRWNRDVYARPQAHYRQD